MRSSHSPAPWAPLVSMAVLAWGLHPAIAHEADLAAVSLFEAQRHGLLNGWGGTWGVGNAAGLCVQHDAARGGRPALCLEFGHTRTCQYRFVQCWGTEDVGTGAYYQTRDLGRYQRLEFDVRNDTGVALQGFLRCPDDRESGASCTLFRYRLSAQRAWMHVVVSLEDGAAGCPAEGRPQLDRVLSLDFGFQPHLPFKSGRVYLDNVVLVERGGPMDVDTAPLAEVAERLARRQWEGLWASRSRVHGLIPNTSFQVSDAGLNTTAAVLWMLPAAQRHGWVSAEAGQQYAAQLLHTITRLLDRAKYLPPRNVDWVTLEPSLLPEESSVDAAFLALALHQYGRLASTPAELAAALESTVERFNFAAFSAPRGWCMAYRYATPRSVPGLIDLTYNGYTNEGRLVSLAAHLSRSHHLPIETHWNADVHRVRAPLTGGGPAPAVHRLAEFRAPFAQALLNLFVDVRQRGADGYPKRALAVNPWRNFVEYETAVMARLGELGRAHLTQPDAGDDGTTRNYRPFSLYDDGGQGDLFMPWSAAFVLLSGVEGGEAALRSLLGERLHGPFGLVDSARWATGAPQPYAITTRHDFWNTALSTMALLEWLDGEQRQSKSFAELPEVRAALDRVLPGP